MESYTKEQITIARQTRWIIMNRRARYGYHIPMFGVIALLLTPIYEDVEGMYHFFKNLTVELIDHRKWVIEEIDIESALENFEVWEHARAIVIERVKEFWQGTGTREDFRRFMSKNPWIWNHFNFWS